MATKKTAAAKPIAFEGIDLDAFAAQKRLIEQKANEALAGHVEAVRNHVREMQKIVDFIGVSVDVGDLISDLQDARYSLEPNKDWNSSSAYC